MAEYSIIKDSDLRIRETITDSDGSAYNLTDAIIRWMLLDVDTSFDGNLDSLWYNALVTKDTESSGGITITDPENGIFDVTLNPEDTQDISVANNYYVLLRVRLANGNMLPIESYRVGIDA